MATDDMELEERLRLAAEQFDPVPERARRIAEGAFARRTLDAELADLVFDSSTERAAELVRGGGQPQLLTFRAGGLTIDLEATGGRLLGQVLPPEPMEIAVRSGGGTVTVRPDADGRFIAAGIHSGPLSLRCQRAAGGPPVVTDWVTLFRA